MTKENKIVEKNDLIASNLYAEKRKEYRKELVEFKKNRRVALGPHATFYFESYETMLGQIQEMLHIEKGGEEQLKDELEAYNPLIPKGKELVATLMFEIDNPDIRGNFLGKVGGIEEKVFMKVGNEKIVGVSEKDVDRTSDEGKASSVQFIHFHFSNDQINLFNIPNTKINIGIDHNLYNYNTNITEANRKSLANDFI